MLAKCANPDCSMQFKYFREGKLFEFVVTAEGKQCLDGSPPPKQSVRELFWLCAECSRQMSLECAAGEVAVVRRPHRFTAA